MPHLQLTGNVALSGGLGDPVGALILCTPGPVDLSVINGEPIIQDGKLLTCDLEVSPWRRQHGGVVGGAQQMAWLAGVVVVVVCGSRVGTACSMGGQGGQGLHNADGLASCLSTHPSLSCPYLHA